MILQRCLTSSKAHSMGGLNRHDSFLDVFFWGYGKEVGGWVEEEKVV